MTLAVAFLGGLVSCLSPCVLPVIPVFTAFVGGGRVAGRGGGDRARAAGFLLGFAGVFVALWVSLGLVGFAAFDAVPTLRPLAGVAIVGLRAATVIGWQPMVGYGNWRHGTSLGGSFLFGAGVAIGWTPCIGPTLGAILGLAASSGTVAEAGALLLVYSAGLSVPFLAMGLAYNGVRPLYEHVKRYSGAINAVSGAMLIIVGILVFTGSLVDLNGWFDFGFLGDISAKA